MILNFAVVRNEDYPSLSNIILQFTSCTGSAGTGGANVIWAHGMLTSGISLIAGKPHILAGMLLPQTPTDDKDINTVDVITAVVVDDWARNDVAIDYFARNVLEVLLDQPQ